jgi:uncharacterized protein YjiS (DUF1127 family)
MPSLLHTQAAHSRPADPPAILRRVWRRIAEPWRRRAAIRELERIGPRALRDAGIEPHEIESVIDAKLAEERREMCHDGSSRGENRSLPVR